MPQIKRMQGWKTWTGVVGLLTVKLVTLYFDVDMSAADSQAAVLAQAVQAVMGALAVIGVAHKIEKPRL